MRTERAGAWRWGVLLALPLGGQAIAQIPPLPALDVGPAVVAVTPLDPPGGVASAAPLGLEGSAFRPGAMGFPFNALPPPPGLPARGFSITPSIAAQLLGTDNAGQTARNRRAELITTITPGLLLTADTVRLKGTLNYTPSLQIYADDSRQTRLLQRFNGQFLATAIPDTLFLDVRGSAGQQAVGGGFAPQSSPTIGRSNQVQTTAFQVSPYVAQRFGDLATVQAGYAFQSVSQQIGANASGAFTPTGQRFFSNQDFIAHEVYGVARTGADFGRLALEARVTSTDYDGTGVLRNAFRRLGTIEARYAVTRQVAVLGEVGYGTQRYAGRPGFSLAEPVGALGVRLTLSELSRVTLKYVYRDGFGAPALDAVIALGGRTTLFANYSERLTTGAQRAADLLTTTSLDALGNPVDLQTGAPIAQPFTDSFLGAQSSLQRIRRGSASISQSWPRDAITLSLASEQRRPILTEEGNFSFRQSGTSLTLSWTHALTPSTTATASLQHGRLQQQGFGSSQVSSVTTALVSELAPRLVGILQYGLTQRSGRFASAFTPNGGDGGRALQNIVTIGLRQSF